MIPIVNHQYRYILFYSAKVACTHLREVYLALHRAEMSADERARLNDYHNLNDVFPIDWQQDYSGYQRFVFTRNPYSRIVSAFLDQYVYQCGAGVKRMLDGREPKSFLEFLRALHEIPDEQRDSHFQSQAYLGPNIHLVTKQDFRYRWFGKVSDGAFVVDPTYDVSLLATALPTAYRRILKSADQQRSLLDHLIAPKPKRNALLYSRNEIPRASEISLEELDAMVFAPKPEAFLARQDIRALVAEIYPNDFRQFAYATRKVPKTTRFGDTALLPSGFDWQLYREFNPDVANDPMVRNERSAVRHYLEFSYLDDYQRAYNLDLPSDFDWQRYLNLHPDLPAAGVTDFDAARRHYQTFGRREKRALR